MKLGSLNTVFVAPKISEEKMHALQVGMPAEATFPAFPGEVFQGKIVKIDPNIDPGHPHLHRLCRDQERRPAVETGSLRVRPYSPQLEGRPRGAEHRGDESLGRTGFGLRGE